ncbi:hypothetical protein PYCC9005_003648 [Savitreella phatthalungensis]
MASRIARIATLTPRSLTTRTMATKSVGGRPATLDGGRYMRLATSSLNLVLRRLERCGEDGRGEEFDVDLSDGVMNVVFGGTGETYVINRQPPSKQIWLSSPVSGPKRFDFYEGEGWVYTKDGTRLKALLEEEWRDKRGLSIDLEGLGILEDVELD